MTALWHLPPCAFYPPGKQNIQLRKTEKIKMCDHPFPSIRFSTIYIYDLCTGWNFVSFSSLHIGLNPQLFSCPLLHVWPCKLGFGVEGMGVLAAWDTRRKRSLHEAAGGYDWAPFKDMSAQHSTHSPVPWTHPSPQMGPLLWGGEEVMVLHCKEIFWHSFGGKHEVEVSWMRSGHYRWNFISQTPSHLLPVSCRALKLKHQPH